jgi:AcrR family transcriptional regulator
MKRDDVLEEPKARRRTSIGPRRNPASAAAILDAAEAILNEHGPSAFSIEAVARRAGAGKPTIYRWWPNKAALLLEIYARQKRELPDGDTGSLKGDLIAMIRGVYRFWLDTAAGLVFRSIIAEAQSDPQAMRALVAFMDERLSHVAAIFARARDRGELSPAADPDTLAAILSGYLWEQLLTDRIADDADAIARVVDQLVDGARGSPAPARRK